MNIFLHLILKDLDIIAFALFIVYLDNEKALNLLSPDILLTSLFVATCMAIKGAYIIHYTEEKHINRDKNEQ